jgi:hypothetical protein
LEVVAQPFEIGEGVMHALSESEPSIDLVSEGFLEEAEHASCPWDRNCHGSEFSKNFMPFGDSDSLLAGHD